MSLADSPEPGPHPLDGLPRVPRIQVRAETALRHEAGGRLGALLHWLNAPLSSEAIKLGPVEVLPRASGLQRSGVVAQFRWPGRRARLAVGLETPLVHALIDRLLGFERLACEERLQVTPVEWGLMAFLAARGLDAYLGPDSQPDLVVDRVGPDPFPTDGLEPIVTLRWPARIAAVTGSVRLWLPGRLLFATNESGVDVVAPNIIPLHERFRPLCALWRAEAGAVELPGGNVRLRAGMVLTIDGTPLRGTPSTPVGRLNLAVRHDSGRWTIPADPVPLSGGGRVIVTDPVRYEHLPREALAVSPPESSSIPTSQADVPVTLTVEIGRVQIPLSKLADLKPGDVIELGRHSREPVELTSGGRLVARGELVQIDTELGVRVTNVFL